MNKQCCFVKKIAAIVLGTAIVMGIYGSIDTVSCIAADEKKADLSALSGFGKNYTSDEKGKFEVEGVMVVGDSMYNITVEEETIQSWCGERRGRSWTGQKLIDLLNKKTTLFYGSAKGDKQSTEYSDPVEFARPNGESF